MSESSIGKFEVKRLEILSPDGSVDEKLMPDISDEQTVDMYKTMVLARAFDNKALKLQRQGRLGTYASSLGQEAAEVGSGFALEEKDYIFPAFRENALMIQKGYPMHMLLQYWGGDERGNKCPDNLNIFPISIPVGSQIPQAAGAAMGIKLKKSKEVAAVFFGDGASSEPDFHSGMNFAGVFNAPCIFVNFNNHWAISVPRSKQTASKSIAQKAIAYGFEGIQVDGNDIFAVYKATKDAAEKARKGEGPTLIECETYRMGDHTTADDAGRYVPEEELEEWKKKDPIDRLRKYLESKDLWNEEKEKAYQEEATEQVEEEVKKYEEIEPQKTEDLFSSLYSEMTPQLEKQLEEMKKWQK